MSQDKPTKSPVIVMIPRTDLVVPDWNPRKFMEEGPLQVLTDYIAKGGPVPRILVWKGIGSAPWFVISGQRRLEAFRRLGREQVEVEILDITLEEAMIMANTSNDNEALFWLDRFEGWERLKREQVWDQATLAIKLGKSNAQTNRAIRTLRVLNANSRQLIRETLPGPVTGGSQKGPKITPSISDRNRMHDLKPISGGDNLDPEDNTPPGVLTSWMTLPLTAFLTNPESKNDDREAQAQAEKALPIMIARGLSGTQTGQLVERILKGESPETFQVPVKSPKVKRQSTVGSTRSTASPQPEIATVQPTPIGAEPRNDGMNQKPSAQTPTPTPVTLPAMGKALGQGVHWARKNPLSVLQMLWGWVKKLGLKEVELINRGLIRRTVSWVFNWAIALILIVGAYVGVTHFRPTIFSPQRTQSSQSTANINNGVNPQTKDVPTALKPQAKEQTLSSPSSAQSQVVTMVQEAPKQPVSNNQIPLNPPLSKGDTLPNSTSPTLKKGGQGGFSGSAQNQTQSTGTTPSSSSGQAGTTPKKDDPVAKFIGDAAGTAAKKALGINF